VTVNLAATINQGCQVLGLQLDQQSVSNFCRYIEMLEQWNRAYNLTAIRDIDAMISHHLFDSLAVLPWIEPGRLLDVGTGAGLPGIPLAIARPDYNFTLLDSNGKKTRFLLQVVTELGLRNVVVLQQRAEQVVDKAGFDMVLSRAFASLRDMVLATQHLVAQGGCWLAMKGVYPEAELAQLPSCARLRAVEPVAVPDLAAERHLVILQRQ
jgi:16S rRNA (guanine527-N7)-methyltransferase